MTHTQIVSKRRSHERTPDSRGSYSEQAEAMK
jgi:hypothetical protein